MSSLFGVNQNYFKAPTPQPPPQDVLDEDGFVLIDAVEKVAQSIIHKEQRSETEELELSASIPELNPTTAAISQALAPPSSSSSSSSSASAASPPLPYIFERTDNWTRIQSSNDPHLKIEGPDKDGDVFIIYRNQTLSINTSDPGTYVIQVLSETIDVQFTP